ncbi:NPNT protein, partial [Amia calva]|nr:NPNT protein [Amia calva]
DINECGFLPRPCSHTCMNTHGSYRCYCDSAYLLNADGKSCYKASMCLDTRCQFGCQVLEEGREWCLCPPGLSLAPDNRTCEDIDECQQGMDICTQSRTCRNTFGSFVCVCKDGFVMGMLQDKIKCRGIGFKLCFILLRE